MPVTGVSHKVVVVALLLCTSLVIYVLLSYGDEINIIQFNTKQKVSLQNAVNPHGHSESTFREKKDDVVDTYGHQVEVDSRFRLPNGTSVAIELIKPTSVDWSKVSGFLLKQISSTLTTETVGQFMSRSCSHSCCFFIHNDIVEYARTYHECGTFQGHVQQFIKTGKVNVTKPVSFSYTGQDMVNDQKKLDLLEDFTFANSRERNDRFVKFMITDYELVTRIRKGEFEELRQASNLVPLEDRENIPVFRGSVAMIHKPRNYEKLSDSEVTKYMTAKSMRLKLCDISVRRPKLANARVSALKHGGERNECQKGMPACLYLRIKGWGYKDFNKIKSLDYYTKYKHAIVMGGHGAAFRLSLHLLTGQTVILQDYAIEWFSLFMEPWVHYVPMKRDLSDAVEVLEWVRDNPKGARMIGQNGHQFFKDYLSEQRTYEFLQSLFARLGDVEEKVGFDHKKFREMGLKCWKENNAKCNHKNDI